MNFSKLQTLYIDFDKELSKNYKDPNVFSDKALNISIQIIEEIDSIFEGRQYEYNKNEIKKIEIISRLKSFKKIKGFEVLNVDELLDKIIEKIENILSFNVIKLGYDIFPASKLTNIVETGNKDNKLEKEKESVDKFGILIKLLIDNNINLDDIVIYEENLNKDRIRQNPYKIIHLRVNGTYKTIVVSDEIGQATFVYEGLISLELFNRFSKGDDIEGIFSKKIVYGIDSYYSNLFNTVFFTNNLQVENNKKSSINTNIDNNLIEKYGLKTILGYRRDLEGIDEELLLNSNIKRFNGKLFFGKANSKALQINVGGKKLNTFPNVSFLRDINILTNNSNRSITSSKKLLYLFKALGFEVIDTYKELVGYLETELKVKGNIYKIDGKWFFGDAFNSQKWETISGICFRSFPNRAFNIKNNIGSKNGAINNSIELEKVFIALGLPVIDDYNMVYAKKLELISEELRVRANIFKIKVEEKNELNGNIETVEKYFFGQGKGHKSWPNINGGSLRFFPNGMFNKQNNLGDKTGAINNINELKDLFIVLGLKVIDDDKEIYRKQLEGIENELKEKACIYKLDGKWFFGEVKGVINWPKINGRKLTSFPNINFIKNNNLGNKNGLISSGLHLKELFKVLGMEIID